MYRDRRSKYTAFTLIELLVVIAIIGILSSIVLASLNTARVKARDSRRLADVRQIVNAIELYHLLNGHYPQHTSIDVRCNVPASLAPLVSGGAMSVVPADPTNSDATPNRLCYEYIGIGTAANYSSASSWYCNGRPRTDYQWALTFSTESATANYPRVLSSDGSVRTDYKYCVVGPLR